MNITDEEVSGVVIDIERHKTSSVVDVRFHHKGMVIKAWMMCAKTLDAELKTQKKILTCFGFTNDQIEGLTYD